MAVVGNSLATGYLVSSESELSYVSQIIREHVEVSDHLILIGHSAGGVIAYRIGLYLEEKYGFQQVQVFAVGCPQSFI